jgi:hypothetical protein
MKKNEKCSPEPRAEENEMIRNRLGSPFKYECITGVHGAFFPFTLKSTYTSMVFLISPLQLLISGNIQYVIGKKPFSLWSED